MGPLLYLTLCSVRNRIVVRLRRLKEPRYAVGMVVGLGYLWFVFLRPRRVPGGISGLLASAEARTAIELAGAAILFFSAALTAVLSSWLPTMRRPALNFSKGEIQFLFPAPLTRKELVRYKVLRTQVGVLIASAVLTIVFRGASLANGWMVFAGMTLILANLNLYNTGLVLNQRQGAWRLAPGIIAAAATITLAGVTALDWGALSSLSSAGDVFREITRLANTGPAAIVLWPFRALVRLPLAQTPAAFLRALPGPVSMLTLAYVWTVNSNASFEEGSAELAERIARIRRGPQPSAPKVRSMAAPFRLALTGRPETAILWKNLIAVGRYLSLTTLLRFLPLLFVLPMLLARGSRGGVSAAMAGLCVAIYIMTILLGPQLARNDLRQDLGNLRALKTWPVNGAAIVRGEVAAPAVLLTLIAWLCALYGLIFAASLEVPPSWAVAAALLAPGLILVQLLAQNASAVLWPSWTLQGAGRARGVEVMGQRLIMMLGLLVVLVVAVLPAAAGGAAIGFAVYFVTGAVAIIPAAAGAAAILFAEAFIASQMIGALLDRTDVSAIDAPG
ncbi:MAG TPA: hypothetical protein VFY29_20505 [Terriglobia bacterium]|nr:hypothetical protein [Terriglobia bacterium]